MTMPDYIIKMFLIPIYTFYQIRYAKTKIEIENFMLKYHLKNT